jgi:SAM-dependent methyltransferase
MYLAANGFSLFGLDDSPKGIELARGSLSREGLTAELQIGNMTERLPYDDAFFDAVISIQVIHHADIATIRRIVREIARVLRDGAFVFISVPRQRNQAIQFREIEPNTFVPLDGTEKGLPHHYFTPEELRELFADFDVTDIHLDSTDHYCLSALKS